jgi:aryl-alcohol dehydrogenase-like predicted oxidoreductase
MGMGVIVKEALANGRLTPRNTDPQLALLHQLAAEKHTTPDALALAAVLAQPWVDVVLSGAAAVEHLESNITAVTIDYDEETANKLQSLRESPETYWQTRSNLAWN